MLLRVPPAGFITRFAPAPTGYLHLGHITSAIAVWGMARAFGGRTLLRIEDHDRSRSKPAFETAIMEDLRWLGFEPDEPWARQSDRLDLYRDALESLDRAGLVYACACSRRTIERSTGHADGELRYPGACRDAHVDGATELSRRTRFDHETMAFEDLRLGLLRQVPADQCGDLQARDRHGNWTYQFAVVVDDLHQKIDLVIRGEDLLDSTGRQIQLARLLGRVTAPVFFHHPLIVNDAGRKLSKSKGDTGVRELRALGWTVERVLGRAALPLGLGDGSAASSSELTSMIEAWR